MKISRKRLKKIISEEIGNVLLELQSSTGMGALPDKIWSLTDETRNFPKDPAARTDLRRRGSRAFLEAIEALEKAHDDEEAYSAVQRLTLLARRFKDAGFPLQFHEDKNILNRVAEYPVSEALRKGGANAGYLNFDPGVDMADLIKQFKEYKDTSIPFGTASEGTVKEL